jgi:hypothetical protein
MKQMLAQGSPAKIYLNSGQIAHGLLLNNIEDENAFDEGVRYVPQQNLSNWLENFSEKLVMSIETDEVEGIDLFMK